MREDAADHSKWTLAINIILKVLIVVLTCATLQRTSCFSVSECTNSGLVICAQALFMVFNICLLIVLRFLIAEANLAGNNSDVEALTPRFWSQTGTFCILGLMHLCYGVMFPLVSGTLISIIGLPIWTDYDGTYLKKYWKPLSGWSLLNFVPQRQCNPLEFVLELSIISLALVIFAVMHCGSASSCPDAVGLGALLMSRVSVHLPYVSLSLTGLIILVKAYLYCTILAAGTDESADDGRRVRFSIAKLTVKTAIYFAAFKCLDMEAPLVASPLLAIAQAQLFNDYDHSLWSKYHSALQAEAVFKEPSA